MKIETVIIIGGGLAGLTAAIHLSRIGVPVKLFEKEEYPHHKVCGEYVSREILPYFEQLDLSLSSLKPAEISRLLYSTANGNPVEVPLPLGGLGLSRYAFDDYLFNMAVKNGVEVVQETVSSVEFLNDIFEIKTSEGKLDRAKIVLGAFGKRSVLDKNLNRPFFRKKTSWLAVKSHYKAADFPDDLVALHNFEGGYCGLSQTETGVVNVCYLATYNKFKEHKDPAVFNEKVLRKNPFLDNFLSEATPVFENPLTIAQISFSRKETVKDHVLMLGDAAGLLHPLCGNGMAMAIHSAKIASETIIKYLEEPSIDRTNMEKEYIQKWDSNFKTRLRVGKILQKILLNQNLAEVSQSMVSKMPFLLPQIIKRTHGNPIR
ncbi:FAD-dependent oxidoreductase [Salinimicrobium marinum]|uniref:FAD-dependent oxidoreductase n=1 Tax=Salinimicrobium marinum TaxID=680283 RepID=A0A918VWB9_9FLAO|nr:NAD(P)/FAD-dependent oxidoreductase [Salinimicrobium marinum]GHA30779.1 FAD-dependent oxidoreductase [Salinimicrobium marinum]